MKKIVMILLSTFLLAISSYGQKMLEYQKYYSPGPFHQSMDLAVFFGSSNYFGEVANTIRFNTAVEEMRSQIGVGLNWNYSKIASFGIEAAWGQWYANDLNHQNIEERNWYARSNYVHASINARITILKQKSRRRVYPYLLAGGGLHFHNSQAFAISNDEVQVDKGWRSDPMINGGFGINYFYNRQVILGTELFLSFNRNDQMDNLVYAVVETDRLVSFRIFARVKLFDAR